MVTRISSVTFSAITRAVDERLDRQVALPERPEVAEAREHGQPLAATSTLTSTIGSARSAPCAASAAGARRRPPPARRAPGRADARRPSWFVPLEFIARALTTCGST